LRHNTIFLFTDLFIAFLWAFYRLGQGRNPQTKRMYIVLWRGTQDNLSKKSSVFLLWGSGRL